MKGVIEVGAHYCHLNKELDEWAGRGAKTFLLFEPVKATYDKMMKAVFHSYHRYSFVTYNMALGNTTGKIMMNIEKNNKGQSSSILPPKVHLKQYPWIHFTDKEEVDIDRLDNVEYDRKLYDFLHIDVQGFELEVLRGATESLKYINEIECEINTEELYEGCPLVPEITAFLKEQGFELKSINFLAKNWGDATYLRL